MNLTQAISAVAKRQPRAPAISLGRNGLTYAELDATIARLAGILAAAGISRGDVAGIGMPTSPLHLLTILALARLGAVSLSLSPAEPVPARRDLARRLGVKTVVCVRAEHGVEGLPRLLIERGWRSTGSGPASVPPADVDKDAPWRIALSSGTTGTQKGIPYRHGDTVEYARVHAQVTPGGAGTGTRLLCFRGLDTGFALRPCLRHLLYGGAVVFARSAQPQAMIDAFSRSKVTHAVMSPPLLRTVCEMLGDGGPFFPDLIHLAVGGTVLSPALFGLAQARITPHVYSHYGASEAGLVALADPQLLRSKPECAGRLVTWLEAQAVDENGRVLADGETGALRFRGLGIATEYYLDPEASARTFRHGWFHPGDTGWIGQDGLLFVAGRSDDRINLGGRKIDPREIERVLESHPEVIEAAVFAVRSAGEVDQLCAAVVLRRRLPAQTLLEHCRGALGGPRTPARIFSLRKLPRNDNGKLLRRELQRLATRREPAASRNDARG